MQAWDPEFQGHAAVMFEGSLADLQKLGFAHKDILRYQGVYFVVIHARDETPEDLKSFKIIYPKAELIRALANKKKIACAITYSVKVGNSPERISEQTIQSMLSI